MGHYYPEEREAIPGPRIDSRPEYLKWFDHWLKGIDNGVMNEPPVTVFVRGWQKPSLLCLEDTGTWRNEAAWPPERVRPTPMYLADDGRLVDNAPSQAASTSYEYRPSVGITTGRRGLGSTTPWAMPIDQRLDEAYSLLFTTVPLNGTMELLGAPEVVLHVSSTAETAYFHVRLCDVAADGESRLITDGGLLATHRNSHATPERLVTGEVYALRFVLKHCAYAVEPGHRLRLGVSSAEFQNAWPTGERARNAIHYGGPGASRVMLPIAPAVEQLAPPEFVASPHPLPAATALARPEYAFHLDLVNDTVTCELRAPGGGRTSNHSRYTVSNRDPAHTTIESSAMHVAVHPMLDIRVEATCHTTSDETSYSHISIVQIDVNGRSYFHKSWSDTVPRNLS